MTVTLVSRLRAVAVAALLPVVVAGVGLSSCAAGGPGNAPSVQSPASASTSPSVQSPDGAEASNSQAPTGSPSGQATCRASSPATRMTLTEADNGATVCLARAGTVELYLHGTAADRWSPVAVTGSALRSVPSGKATLPIGVTAGFFAANGAGRAVLSSYRAPCTAADPQATGCDGAHLVRIVVVVG